MDDGFAWAKVIPWLAAVAMGIMGYLMKRELARKDDDIDDLDKRLDAFAIMINGLQRDFDVNGAKKSDLQMLHQDIKDTRQDQKDMRREMTAGFERLYDKIDEQG